MQQKKREHPKEKTKLHPRNRHRERYDFVSLSHSNPDLKKFVRLNEFGDQSIDFFDPEAVKMLNKALLRHFYGIGYWDIPFGYLCPAVPGRADYIHYVADLLGSCNKGKVPTGESVKCLDIGVGANCIYPIIGNREYGWSFVGSETDETGIGSAKRIVEKNTLLLGQIEFRFQPRNNNIFGGIIQPGERFDITLCNPPFHASAVDAQSGTIRKLNNLGRKNLKSPELNFGGRSNELWCDGGEKEFIGKMVLQSRQYASSCLWFSSLVSKESNLPEAIKTLTKVGTSELKTISMGQGNKISRILAWTFHSKELQKKWADEKWI